MIAQLTDNWVCYAILLLASFCYQQLFQQLLTVKSTLACDNSSGSQTLATEQHFSSVLIAALPLLGLLGTIIGLLDCFVAMASDGADAQAMSSGIGDALFTTQLGLVCAIPAWILQAVVRARVNRYQLFTGTE